MSRKPILRRVDIVLPPDVRLEHTFAPPIDESTLFSRGEHVAALRLIMPPAEAERLADELLGPGPGDLQGVHAHLGEDVLNLLSLVSADCAERVRSLRGESHAEAAERIRAFRERLGI